MESLLKLRFNELKQSHINGLNKDELRAGLEKFGGEFHLPTDDPQLFSDFFTAIDEDGSGRIEYKEYRALMVDLLQLVAAKLEANPLTSHQKVGIRKVDAACLCDARLIFALANESSFLKFMVKDSPVQPIPAVGRPTTAIGWPTTAIISLQAESLTR